MAVFIILKRIPEGIFFISTRNKGVSPYTLFFMFILIWNVKSLEKTCQMKNKLQ